MTNEVADKAREIAKKIESGEINGFAFVTFGKDETGWGWFGLTETEVHAAPVYLTRQICKRDPESNQST